MFKYNDFSIEEIDNLIKFKYTICSSITAVGIDVHGFQPVFKYTICSSITLEVLTFPT